MKVATWNINSVRARLERLLDYLATRSPDVLCLQETKCTDEQFPLAEVQRLGYVAELFGQRSYNGVAVLARSPLAEPARNLGDGDDQARVLAVSVGGLRVVSTYAPNGQSLGSAAYEYKLQWYTRLTRWLRAQPTPLVVCGDLNVALTDVDTYDPKVWEGQVLASPREREALASLISAAGLVDLVRHRHPAETGLFTWWDYRAGALKRNQGLRIDYILASAALEPRCTDVRVDRLAREGTSPSDHAPVEATFQL